MKNLTPAFSSVLVVFALFLIYGCDKGTSDTEVIAVSSENKTAFFQKSLNYTPEEYGFFHNEGLRIFMEAHPNYQYTTFETLVSDIATAFHEAYPDVHFEVIDYERAHLIFDLKNASFKEVMKNTYQGYVDPKVEVLLDYILTYELSYEQASAKISEYLSHNELEKEALKSIKIFSAVAEYSHTFWTTRYGQRKMECDPEDQVYFADAVGLIIFGPFGGIGYSWAIDAAQDEFEDGGCIK